MRAALASVSALLAGSTLFSVPALAQTVRGTVVDEATKAPLANATLSALDRQGRELGRSVRTDSSGSYTLHIAVIGTYQVRVMRLGYRPLSSGMIQLNGGEVATVNFAMTVVEQRLGTVVVTGRKRYTRDELMSLVGYDLRRTRGVGLFLDTSELRPHMRNTLAHVLADFGTVPQIKTIDAYGAPALAMMRGMGLCPPQVFIDGWAVGHHRVFGMGADEVHGVEIYSPITMPPPSIGGLIGDFGGTSRRNQCGAIVIWTKQYRAAVLSKTGKGPPG